MLEFVSSVVDSFDISTRGTHIGVVVFSHNADIPLYFNTLRENNLTAGNVKHVIKNLRHKKNWMSLDKALLVADEELFNEATGMRSEIPQVTVVRRIIEFIPNHFILFGTFWRNAHFAETFLRFRES